MENINQNVAHIYCSKCDRYWQALNEDQNDWDEEQTAQKYKEDIQKCNICKFDH